MECEPRVRGGPSGARGSVWPTFLRAICILNLGARASAAGKLPLSPRQVPTKLWRMSTRVFEEPRGGQHKCQDCVGTLLYGALTFRATRGRAERDSIIE